MTTSCSDSTLTPHPPIASSELKNLLIEPLLVAGVSAFWLVTLPIVATSLLCVKAWDAITCHHPNPLILRRGGIAASGMPDSASGHGSTRAANV